MRREGNTYSIGDAFKKMLKSYHIDKKYVAERAVGRWAELMGEPIARRTEKVFYFKGVLYAKIDSAPLKHELHMGRDKILTLFQKEFGEELIREVRII